MLFADFIIWNKDVYHVSRKAFRKIDRRKALKAFGSVGLASVGFSGSAAADSKSETPGAIRIISDSEKKLVMETEYKDETLRITYFKKGSQAGQIHYEGPSVVDGLAYELPDDTKASTQAVTTSGALDPVKRKSTFRKKIGGCHRYNYQHRFIGGSVKLSKNAGALGYTGLSGIIAYLLPGGKVAAAVGVIVDFILNRFGGKRTFTFGVRDYDLTGIHTPQWIAAAGYGWNVSAGNTIPAGTPNNGHLKR